MRDFAQTVALAKKHEIEGNVIGIHGGTNLLKKFQSYAALMTH